MFSSNSVYRVVSHQTPGELPAQMYGQSVWQMLLPMTKATDLCYKNSDNY